MSLNLTRWEIRERTVVRTREDTGSARAQRSPRGRSPSRGSLTPTVDDSRPSPTFLLEGRSIGRPATPSSSKSPSPQVLHPDCRPSVKFTVEEDQEWNAEGTQEEEAPANTRAKQIFMSHQPPPLPLPTTPPPYQPPTGTTPPPAPAPDGRSLGEPEGEDEEDDEEDYSASVSAILQQRRQASTRRSRRRSRRTSSPFSPLSPDGASLTARHDRRRSSVFTTSSADTGFSVAVADGDRVIGGVLEGETAIPEGAAEAASPTAVAAATQQQIFENLRLHKEVRESVRLQPWPMRRKVRLVQRAKAYVRRHEGELQERLAHGKTTRDLLARVNLLIVKHWQHLKRELINAAAFLIPWEHRIKEIESHFGSVVASYFTFLRWLFWVNVVIATLLIAFVIIPELLVGREHGGWDDRKEMLPEEKATATNLLTLWDFEGALKYSPMFYGFYSSREKTDGGYRIPFAYFMTGLAVYVYSFVATLRKMAENSRMSKLSEKDDECVFSWKLFTGWDYMIGNAETAHNRVASIILGFKEVLLEEREKQKDRRNWKVIGLRVLVNILVLFLLASSAYAVVLVVRRSTKATTKDSWWRQNEITVVLSLISVAFPVLFELIGFLESYHPRKQLRIQLARIMVLNLLNLYTLIFALFGKISNMTRELQELKPKNINSTSIPYSVEGNVSTSSFQATSLNSSYINISYVQKDELTTAMTTTDALDTTFSANTSSLLSISPQCFKELVRCIVEATTFQNSSQINTEKEMISVLVNVTATLIPLFLEIFLHSNVTQTFLSPEHSSTATFTTTDSPWLNRSSGTDDLKNFPSSLITTSTFSPTVKNNYSEEITNEFSTTIPVSSYSKSLTLAEFYTISDQPTENSSDLPFASATESSTLSTDTTITTLLGEISNTTDENLIIIIYDHLATSNLTEENNTYSTDVIADENEDKNSNSLFQDNDPRYYLNGTTTLEDEVTDMSKEPINKRETTGTLENDSNITFSYIEDNVTYRKSTNFPLTGLQTSPIISITETITESSTENSTTNEPNTMLTNTIQEDSKKNKREDHLSTLEENEATDLLFSTDKLSTTKLFFTETLSTGSITEHSTMTNDATTATGTVHDNRKKIERDNLVSSTREKEETVANEPLTTKPNSLEPSNTGRTLTEFSVTKQTTVESTTTKPTTKSRILVSSTPEIAKSSTTEPEFTESAVIKEMIVESSTIKPTTKSRILVSSIPEIAESSTTQPALTESTVIKEMTIESSTTKPTKKSKILVSSTPEIAESSNTKTTLAEFLNAELTTKHSGDESIAELLDIFHNKKDKKEDILSTIQEAEVRKTSISIDDPLTMKRLVTESLTNNPSTKSLMTDDYTIKLANAFFGYAKMYKREVPATKKAINFSTDDFLDLGLPLPLINKTDNDTSKKEQNITDPTNANAKAHREGENDLKTESKNGKLIDESSESTSEINQINEFHDKNLKNNQTNARSFLVAHIVTIILTAAILVSKEEDSKLITEKLFERDENKISELVAAWKQSLQQERQMKNTQERMGEKCFTMHCRERTYEVSSKKIELNKPEQNCSMTPCSSEDSAVTTANYGFASKQMIEEGNKSSVEPTAYPVTPKPHVAQVFLSNLDTRRKLRRLCWETMFGQELVKLTVMDLVLTIASTLLVDFVRALFVRIMNHCWCWDLEKQFPQYGDFKIAENILHLVYNQGMVWMGMFFSPGLPALNLAKLAIVLYVRSWVVLTCNVPHDVVFRASRSNNFYLALLLTMLFLCALPVGYALVWVEPSWHCGPFAGRDRISSLFTSSVRAAFPDSLRPVLDYVASPALIIPLLVLLVLVVAYLLALAAALREANDDLRAQLRRERTEERRKMFRIANGRGRRGRKARGGMPRDCRAASDDASAMGVLDDFVEGEVADGEVVVAATPIKETEDAAVQGASGWRSLIGRIANLRTATSRSVQNVDKTGKNNSFPVKEIKTPDNASKGDDGGDVSSSQQTQRTPSVETTRRQIRCLDEMEDGMLPHKSSSSSRGDRDSPSSTCWSGDIPLIRIVRTADEGNRTPQQAQPQQPTGSYENAALDQTSESNQQESIQLTDK